MDYSFDEFLDDMVKGGARIVSDTKDALGKITDVKLEWPDMEKFQDEVVENAERVFNEISRTPDNIGEGLVDAAEKGKEELIRLKDSVLNAEVDPSLPEISLDIKIPDINSPDLALDADFNDVWDAWKKYNEYFNGKKAVYRRSHGGYVIYLLEDGTYYYIKNSNWQMYMLAALGVATTVAVV